MSGFNEPRYSLPLQYRAFFDGRGPEPLTYGYGAAVAPEYPTVRIASDPLARRQPPTHSHTIDQHTRLDDFENIPPPHISTRSDRRMPPKKRKHYDTLDTANHKQSAVSSDVSGAPFLPGAALYEHRRRGPSAVSQQVSMRQSRSRSPCMEHKHRRIERPTEHRILQRSHSTTMRTEASLLPIGTQHNPLEIASSPEPEPRPKTSKKKKYYAVAAGHVPGVYTEWVEAERQLKGYPGTKHKGFATRVEADAWLQENTTVPASRHGYDGHSARVLNASEYYEPPPPYTAAHPRSLDFSPMEDPAALAALQSKTQAPSALRPASPSNMTSAPVDPEPVLKPEQQKVVDLILQGHNVFYTGSAGCGKSTILKAFVKQLQNVGKRVKIVAPTNLAALNVGGVTTWAFAGWTPDSMKKPLDKLMQASHGKEVYERFDTTDVLVIDEISMVENLLFERLNVVMKTSRGEKYGGGPFGGAQVIVTGDFCQLSPVKPFQHCIGCGWELARDNQWRPKEYWCENKRCGEDRWLDIDKWAFRSKAWQECDFKHVNLTEIHRQSDRKFISILQKIRTDGIILKPHANILLNHTSETEGAIKLFARRDDVDRINNENIAKLPAEATTYKCVDHFHWKDHHKEDISLEKNQRPGEDGTLAALKEHRYEVYVQLKEGMRVVLQANLDPNGGLVNGSQGTITGFEPFDEKKLPRKAEDRNGAPVGASFTRGAHARYFEEQIKIFAGQNKKLPWPIVRFDNGTTRTIFADCTASELGNEEPFSLLSRTQIPLMAGYAITVHKSQGMTLDRVIVDLSRAFEPSQIYVALSRARSLMGLKVIGLPRTNLGGANEQVKEFFNTHLKNK